MTSLLLISLSLSLSYLKKI
uniref:Uncharacterized protein n=1 Tax=Anguilla anguilla TaxID=7936 RepID=A0A0E9V0D0_ANGAN